MLRNCQPLFAPRFLPSLFCFFRPNRHLFSSSPKKPIELGWQLPSLIFCSRSSLGYDSLSTVPLFGKIRFALQIQVQAKDEIDGRNSRLRSQTHWSEAADKGYVRVRGLLNLICHTSRNSSGIVPKGSFIECMKPVKISSGNRGRSLIQVVICGGCFLEKREGVASDSVSQAILSLPPSRSQKSRALRIP